MWKNRLIKVILRQEESLRCEVFVKQVGFLSGVIESVMKLQMTNMVNQQKKTM